MADCVHATSNIYDRMIVLRSLKRFCFQEFHGFTGGSSQPISVTEDEGRSKLAKALCP